MNQAEDVADQVSSSPRESGTSGRPHLSARRRKVSPLPGGSPFKKRSSGAEVRISTDCGREKILLWEIICPLFLQVESSLTRSRRTTVTDERFWGGTAKLRRFEKFV